MENLEGGYSVNSSSCLFIKKYEIAIYSMTGWKYFYECIFAENFHAFQTNSLLLQCFISVATFLIAKTSRQQLNSVHIVSFQQCSNPINICTLISV